MLQNFYVWTHTNTPFHFWDWPAFVVAVVIIVIAVVHHRNQKKRENEFNETMEENMTNLDQVLNTAGVAGATDVIINAAELADIPGPKQAEAK